MDLNAKGRGGEGDRQSISDTDSNEEAPPVLGLGTKAQAPSGLNVGSHISHRSFSETRAPGAQACWLAVAFKTIAFFKLPNFFVPHPDHLLLRMFALGARQDNPILSNLVETAIARHAGDAGARRSQNDVVGPLASIMGIIPNIQESTFVKSRAVIICPQCGPLPERNQDTYFLPLNVITGATGTLDFGAMIADINGQRKWHDLHEFCPKCGTLTSGIQEFGQFPERFLCTLSRPTKGGALGAETEWEDNLETSTLKVVAEVRYKKALPDNDLPAPVETSRGHYGLVYLNKATTGAQGILYDPLVGETLIQDNREWGETTALVLGRAKKGARLGLGQSGHLNSPHPSLELIPGFDRKDFPTITHNTRKAKGKGKAKEGAKGSRASGATEAHTEEDRGGGEASTHPPNPPPLPYRTHVRKLTPRGGKATKTP